MNKTFSMAPLQSFLFERKVTFIAFTILVAHYNSIMCSHTKRCFKENGSEVIWNITFTDPHIKNINNTNIVMQTKDKFQGPTSTWTTLNNCKRHRTSIQCEIDSDTSRWRYLLRVVKIINSTIVEHLLVEEKEGHHQSGFRCHHNHEEENDFIRNLTVRNLSANSLDIAWTFYEWDISEYHLLWVKINVREEEQGRSVAKIKFSLEDDTSLLQTHPVPGLNPCTRYMIEITGHYDASFDRTVRTRITTKCKSTESKTPISVFEITIICLSCVVFFAAVPFLVYVVLQRRRTPVLKRLQSRDVIDPQDVIDQDRLFVGMVRHSSDELICPRTLQVDDECVSVHELRFLREYHHNF